MRTRLTLGLVLGLASAAFAQSDAQLAKELVRRAGTFPVVHLKYSRSPLPFVSYDLSKGEFTLKGTRFVGLRLIAPPRVSEGERSSGLLPGYDFGWSFTKMEGLGGWQMVEAGRQKFAFETFASVFNRWQDPDRPDTYLSNTRRILQLAPGYVRAGKEYLMYFKVQSGSKRLIASIGLYEKGNVASFPDFCEFLLPVLKASPPQGPDQARWDDNIALGSWLNMLGHTREDWTKVTETGFGWNGKRYTFADPATLAVGMDRVTLTQGTTSEVWTIPPGRTKLYIDRLIERCKKVFPNLAVVKE